VSVSASAQKETHKQKPVFQAAVEVEDEALAAVLSVAPESSITCGCLGESAEGNLHVEANIRDRLEVEVVVLAAVPSTVCFWKMALTRPLKSLLLLHSTL
jgi:hypothetical protein